MAEGETAHVVTVDCEHGTTTVTTANAPKTVQITTDNAARIALLKHNHEQGCACIRRLWRKAFGCPWPQMITVSRVGA